MSEPNSAPVSPGRRYRKQQFEKIATFGTLLGPFDEIMATTGCRPDLSFQRELRLDLDPTIESTRTLAPLVDPNFHSSGSVSPHGEPELRHSEPDVYLVGSNSYGRAPASTGDRMRTGPFCGCRSRRERGRRVGGPHWRGVRGRWLLHVVGEVTADVHES